MAIIVDLIRPHNEHHVFNSETISAIESIYDKNTYYIDKNSTAIDFINKKSRIYKITVKKSKVYSWIWSTFLLLYILFKNRREKLILLSATPLQYKICAILSNIFNIAIFIFMHGELGYLTSSNGTGQKLGRYFINNSLNKKSKVTFISISEYIYTQLLPVYQSANIKHIEHPLQQIDTRYKQKNKKINIGTFGILSRNKASEKIYELAENLPSSIFEKINIMTIGLSDGSFIYDSSKNVQHFCKGTLGSSLIPKDIFLDHVNNLDFVLFFNDDDEKYNLIPSGVFSDCISFQLPIISLTTKKIKFFFDRYGKIGYLCKDIQSMVDVIKNIDLSSPEFTSIEENIAKIKSLLSKDSYILNIKSILDEKA